MPHSKQTYLFNKLSTEQINAISNIEFAFCKEIVAAYEAGIANEASADEPRLTAVNINKMLNYDAARIAQEALPFHGV